MSVLILILINAYTATAVEIPNLKQLATELCNLPLSQLSKQIISKCPECNFTKLRNIVFKYRSSQREVQNSKIGNVQDWQQATTQSDQIRNHAFAKRNCAVSTAKFEKENWKLSFLATDHVYKNPSRKSEIFNSIRTNFNSFNPRAVIIEGYPNSFPCSSAVHIFLSKEEDLTHESEFLAKLALNADSLVVGGEPTTLRLSPIDQDGLRSLRLFVVSKNPIENAQKIFNETVGNDNISFNDDNWNFEKFKNWYRNLNDREFLVSNAYEDITPSYNITSFDRTVRDSNLLIDKEGIDRDNAILLQIRNQLLLNRKVMVLYGYDHFPRQLATLESIFGKQETPVSKCPPRQTENKKPPKLKQESAQ